MGDCPQCFLVQLYTWGVFVGLLMAAWERVMAPIMERLTDESGSALAAKRSVRRTFLTALVLYALVATWLRVVFLAVLAYVGAAVVSMSAEYALAEFVRNFLRALSNPAYLFHCLTAVHVPFHAGVALALFLAGFAAVCGYVTDADLAPTEQAAAGLRAKWARIAFTTPAVMLAVYGVYVLYNCMLTMQD